MTIEYKKQSIIVYEADGWGGVEYETKHWSNLLDAAKDPKDSPQLEDLIKKASVKDINTALSTLEKAFSLSCKYEPVVWVCDSFDARAGRECSPEIPSKIIAGIRTNLLERLVSTPVHLDCLKIKFTDNDKRYIGQMLLAEVKQCQTISELLILYRKYEQSPILEHRRNSHTDRARGLFFGMSYSTLKKDFIEALQLRALNISPSACEQDATLERTLFASQHFKKGVSRLSNQLNNNSLDVQLELQPMSR
jgi:hypothetical protein